MTTALPRSRRFWLGAAIAGLVGAVAAGCARGACSWHRNGHGLHGVSSPEEALDRARLASKWVLRELDATEEQKRRIDAVVAESVDYLYPLVERHRRNHRELLEALARPEVDRAEVERLRKAEIELADAASNWLADAAIEALGVLTPEQRTELLAHVRQRHQL